MHGPKEPPFPERRTNHALRALYERVASLESEADTLRKLCSDQDKALSGLEREAVTYKALAATVVTIALALFAGAWKFSAGVEESAQRTASAATSAVSAQTAKLDAFMDRQAATNVKTEALYLRAVELKSPAEARAVVLQTAKEK